jgi:ribosomal protein S18 acetylase RimI-like enzyme
MTSASATTHPGGHFELRVLSPQDGQFRPSIALVLTGRVGLNAIAEEYIANLERAVLQQGLRMELAVVALSQQRVVNAALVIESPGRTALVYTPPTRSGPATEAIVELLGVVRALAPARGIQVLQTLLGVDENARAEAHAAAGFWFLAELIYLERAALAVAPSRKVTSEQSLRFVTYSAGQRALFREALAASYEDTCDCPALNGLRDLDDVLEGHMATGLFDPSGWMVAMSKGQPAGIILAAQLPARAAVEVVYMGVAKSSRGQGVGDELLQAALDYARRLGAPTLSLAVDSTNAPARRLYARWSFHETMRRRAWMAALRGA